MLIYENIFTTRTVVNAVLLKMVSELYQSRCDLLAINVNRDASSAINVNRDTSSAINVNRDISTAINVNRDTSSAINVNRDTSS